MFSKGLTKRWIWNIFAVVAVLLISIALILSLWVYNYYISCVRQAITSRYSNLVQMFFINYIGDTNTSELGFRSAAREFVENFADKDKMEIWVINSSGDVIVTSSGFEPNVSDKMLDYDYAINNNSHYGEWIGTLDTGEKIMAYSFLLSDNVSDGNAPAVRYIVSLDDVDSQAASIIIFINIVCFSVLLIVVVSGAFFIRSIVRPVGEVSKMARSIANGNYSKRIKKKYDDEIGELCDTINYMAEQISESDRLKNDFISTISHELRTPLTAIAGWSETLSTGEELVDDKMMKKGLNVITKETYRLSNIVEELLDFSRIQSGGMKLRIDKIDILDQLDEAVFVFRDRAQREGISINYVAPEVPAPAYCDADRIKQVFVNILDNAFKYNRKNGSVGIYASINNNKIDIVFSDNGIGISKEALPHVTEKFYKEDKNTRGSGIGLAVVSEIIKLHNGQLLIKSEVGKGTTIKISLDLIPVQSSETNA